jgi:uncharacterized cupredoxin-like copper-binding protein
MLKFFGIVGLAGFAVTVYLVTYGVGHERQMPPEVSLLEGFREEGFVPENRSLAIDESAEEAEVFEVPEQDGVILAEAIANGGMAGMDMSGGSMEGMDMSGSSDGGDAMAGMDMSGNGEEPVLDMDMDGDGVMDMSSASLGNMSGSGDGAMAGMNMAGDGEEPVLDMDMDGDGVMDMSSASLGNMSGSGDGSMAGMNMGNMDMEGMEMGEGGLGFAEEGKFDREIELSMEEWKFSDMELNVKMGERIKFTVKNGGQIPHEFMFMTGPLMTAANYRGTRADWNLLEHEALFEQALVLPGGEFTFVVQVQQTGSWMFMCMLPYHMQMGMMGQMATEGMFMDMDM